MAQWDSEENIFINKSQVVDYNFWRTGNTIDISGQMNKDVVVYAKNVVVDGVIEGDLIAVASQVIVNGNVNGNIRVIAEEVRINGPVGKNLTAVTEKLDVNNSVGWGITSYANEFNLNYEQTANVNVFGQQLNINKSVEGSVWLNALKRGLIKFADDVNISGNLIYSNINFIENLDKVSVSGQKQAIPSFNFGMSEAGWNSIYLFTKIIAFLSTFILGYLVLRFYKTFTVKISYLVTKDYINSFSWGVILMVVIPFIAGFLLVTGVGVSVSVTLISLYIACYFLAKIFVGLAIGVWLLKKEIFKAKLVLPFFLGLLVVYVLTSIPYIGSLMNIILTGTGFGALLKMLHVLIRGPLITNGKIINNK